MFGSTFENFYTKNGAPKKYRISCTYRRYLPNIVYISLVSLKKISLRPDQYCCSTVSVLSQYCCGIVAVLLRYCLGTVAVLLRYCCGTVAVLSQYCLGAVLVLSRHCLGTVSILSWYCLGTVGCCRGTVAIL